jgi:hypothetical protein
MRPNASLWEEHRVSTRYERTHPSPVWRSLLLALVLTLTSAVALQGGALAADGITIDPDVNDFSLPEGATEQETIEVTVPAGAGVAAADVYFLMDTTGSMGGPISSIRSAATAVMTSLQSTYPDVDLAFGAGDFKDFQSPNQFDRYAFRHQVSLTNDVAAVQGAVDAWLPSGGNDLPEGQFYAFDQLAENRAPSNDGTDAATIGWRPGAKRILVVFGDAPGHDPVCSAITAQVPGHALPYDITEASVTAKLVDAGITFIGISTTTGLSEGMDGAFSGSDYGVCGTAGATVGPGQATRIATATGGAHLINVSAAAIATAVEERVGEAVETINNLRLVPTGDTAQFVTAIDPATGYGPLELDTGQVLEFEVDWTGVVAATDVDQVFTGTIDAVADGSVVAQKSVRITVPGTAVVEPACVDLVAGQHIVAGEVCVVDDGDTLFVSYSTHDGWTLSETHLHVADDVAGIPQNKAGNPRPGHFSRAQVHLPMTTGHTYQYALTELDAEPAEVLAIAAHAVVRHPARGTESAWGAGERFVPRGNWAMHFGYTVR